MTELIIIRHGETEWNQTGRFQGHSDVPLSEKGRAQAEALAQNLIIDHVDAIYASDLIRAMDTAAPLARRFGVDVIPDTALRELNFGTWEGRNFSDINAECPDGMKHFYSDPEKANIPNGEPFPVFQKRVAGRVSEIVRAQQGKRVVIFSHGASIRILLADILAMPIRSIWHVSQLNTAVNKIRFEDDGFAIVTLMNDTSHLRTEDVR
ncbi:putative alpha-ribazole phosphatase [Selenomonas sp. oral taxon 892 str. F0426]|uniref:histidine phosphatase family protein n=1 Tax=Selenomonas sp. oral taxon 892 TaxID=1321785 RepID=UPI0003AD4CE9|nr:histidine phosphatase family protein [Selenomonas sp. oral taxon 892]ERJ95975.1 putative alpha-ribazole phosphatase [Selenomonas sp. oral taxon 892 str. F0426]